MEEWSTQNQNNNDISEYIPFPSQHQQLSPYQNAGNQQCQPYCQGNQGMNRPVYPNYQPQLQFQLQHHQQPQQKLAVIPLNIQIQISTNSHPIKDKHKEEDIKEDIAEEEKEVIVSIDES